MKDELRRVQLCQLDLALELKRICEKYNIRYFLVGGTLLGAIRHSGFIPWADDIDIGMLREDFEKFQAVALTELSDKYFLQTMNTDEHYSLPLAKLRKNGTLYIEGKSKKSKSHKGIFIDIFIFDNIPESTLLQKKQDMLTSILYRLMLMKNNYEPWDGKDLATKIKYIPFRVLAFLCPKKLIRKMYIKEITRYSEYNTKQVVTYGGCGYNKEKIDKSLLSTQIEIKFENSEFSCPEGYNEYLTKLYGDYMTLPPEDKRVSHHGIIKLDLGVS